MHKFRENKDKYIAALKLENARRDIKLDGGNCRDCNIELDPYNGCQLGIYFDDNENVVGCDPRMGHLGQCCSCMQSWWENNKNLKTNGNE